MFIISKTLQEGALLAARYNAILINKMAKVLEAIPLLRQGKSLVVPFREIPADLALPFGTDFMVSQTITAEDGFTPVISGILQRSGNISELTDGPRLSYFKTADGADDLFRMSKGFILDHPDKMREALDRLKAGDHVIANMAVASTGFRAPTGTKVHFHPECPQSGPLREQCEARIPRHPAFDPMSTLRQIAHAPTLPLQLIVREPDLTQERLDQIRQSLSEIEMERISSTDEDDSPQP